MQRDLVVVVETRTYRLLLRPVRRRIRYRLNYTNTDFHPYHPSYNSRRLQTPDFIGGHNPHISFSLFFWLYLSNVSSCISSVLHDNPCKICTFLLYFASNFGPIYTSYAYHFNFFEKMRDARQYVVYMGPVIGLVKMLPYQTTSLPDIPIFCFFEMKSPLEGHLVSLAS